MDSTSSLSTLTNEVSTSAMEATNIDGNVQQPNNSSQISRMDNVNEVRICWICLENNTDNPSAVWVHPCKCRGSTKWVHQICLQRWIDERQKGNTSLAVSCHLCKTEYIIVCPHMGVVANSLEDFDNLIQDSCPFLVGGIFVGSLYWAAVSYGTVAFIQIVGCQNGLDILKRYDPLILLIGLPIIPVGLIVCRMIRWQNIVLHLIHNCRNIARVIPLVNYIIPYPDEQRVAGNPVISRITNATSASRIICGALLLPTISSFIGHVFFESFDNTLHRTLLGGLTYLTVKSIAKMYLKYQQIMRQNKRRIIDYTEENIQLYDDGNPGNIMISPPNTNGFNDNNNNYNNNYNNANGDNRNESRNENSGGRAVDAVSQLPSRSQQHVQSEQFALQNVPRLNFVRDTIIGLAAFVE